MRITSANRYHGLYGAARAAEVAGDRPKATECRTAVRPGRLDWRRVAASTMLAAAIVVGMPEAVLADPSETDPKGIARDPDYIAGKWAIDAREWSEAARRLSRAVQRDPDNADLHNYLGFAYRNLGRLEPALEHYRRALVLNPRHRGALEYAGEAYLMAGNLAKAEEYLE